MGWNFGKKELKIGENGMEFRKNEGGIWENSGWNFGKFRLEFGKMEVEIWKNSDGILAKTGMKTGESKAGIWEQ